MRNTALLSSISLAPGTLRAVLLDRLDDEIVIDHEVGIVRCDAPIAGFQRRGAVVQVRVPEHDVAGDDRVLGAGADESWFR